MEFLIFQQLELEHPAIFVNSLPADGIEWHASQIPEYRESLKQIAGAYGPQRLEQQTIERINDFRHFSRTIHRNFLKIVETRRAIG